jgi:hypothetical protein
MADQQARHGSLCSLTGPQPALGIYAEVAREVIRDWTNRKHEEYGGPFVDKRKLRAFLKDPLLKNMENYST